MDRLLQSDRVIIVGSEAEKFIATSFLNKSKSISIALSSGTDLVNRLFSPVNSDLILALPDISIVSIGHLSRAVYYTSP